MFETQASSFFSTGKSAPCAMQPGQRHKFRALVLLSIFCGTFSHSLPAQNTAACKGPDDLESAVRSHPSASAWNALGAWFGGRNDLPCAISAFESGLRLAPNSSEGHYDLALALLNQGDAQRASQELQKALALKPEMLQAHAALGVALSRLNQTAAAIREFRIVLKQDHTSIAALDGIAKSFIAEKRFSEAVTALQNAPDVEPLQLDLAAAYSGQGNVDKAVAILSSLLAKNPSDLQAQTNLGLVYASASRYNEAEEALRKAVALNPENPSTRTSLAMILSRLDRKDEAIEEMRKVCALDPSSSDAHLNLGIALADEVQLDNALVEFTEAVRLAPGSAAAHYNKGRLLLDMQRHDEAKQELEASLRFDPHLASSWYLLGLIARGRAKDEEAAQIFQKVVELDPRNPEAHYMLGREMLNSGDKVGAMAEWRKTIELQPNYGEALYNLARILARSDPQESKRLEDRFQSLLAEQHVMDRARLLGNFALASARAHDWPQAISQMKEAFTACGSCAELPQLHKDFGLIYCRSGNFREGKEELLEAQKLLPNDAEIRKSLQILASQ